MGSSIDTQLGKSLYNFAGITSASVDPGGGGSIDTQLGKSLCNFAGITSDNVDPGGGSIARWPVNMGLGATPEDKCPISMDNKFLHLFEHFSPAFPISTNKKTDLTTTLDMTQEVNFFPLQKSCRE